MASAACHGGGIRTLSFLPPADCSTCRFLDAGGSAGFDRSRSRLPVPAESCKIQSYRCASTKQATRCVWPHLSLHQKVHLIATEPESL
jgi:hypothetical protein